jgi:hypothetical protein
MADNPRDTYAPTQHEFFREVCQLAEKHGARHHHDSEEIMMDLCANILSVVLAADETGFTVGEMFRKAHGQAAYFRRKEIEGRSGNGLADIRTARPSAPTDEEKSTEAGAIDLAKLKPEGSA